VVPRKDMLDKQSPPGLEIFQLTAEPDVPASHVYMEAQIFTSDSRRFVLHRSAHPHGSDPKDPKHRYLLCDLENECELTPITDELGTTAPSISPDDQFLYYFVDETGPGRGRLTLKRVRLDGSEREVIVVIDGPLAGSGLFLSRPYPLSTISSDGKRIIISGFLGDGQTEDAPWGYIGVDIERAEVQAVALGSDWVNLHPQYSRDRAAGASRDVLIQHNHGTMTDCSGNSTGRWTEPGCDIHVVHDDGTDLRAMPWGRDGNEYCQGHQCWVGRSNHAITSTGTRSPEENQLIEGVAVPHTGHLGAKTPGGWRNDLSRSIPDPHFFHFATDIAGRRFITDSGPMDTGGGLWAADLPQQEGEPLKNWMFLLNPRSSWSKVCHIHPFLSPDGKVGFFNSDESGLLQAYMVRGF